MKYTILLLSLLASTMSYADFNAESASQKIAKHFNIDLAGDNSETVYQGIFTEFTSTSHQPTYVRDELEGRPRECLVKISLKDHAIDGISIFSLETGYSPEFIIHTPLNKDNNSKITSGSSEAIALSTSLTQKLDRADLRGGGTHYITTKTSMTLSPSHNGKIEDVRFEQSEKDVEIWNLMPVPAKVSYQKAGVCEQLSRIK